MVGKDWGVVGERTRVNSCRQQTDCAESTNGRNENGGSCETKGKDLSIPHRRGDRRKKEGMPSRLHGIPLFIEETKKKGRKKTRECTCAWVRGEGLSRNGRLKGVTESDPVRASCNH